MTYCKNKKIINSINQKVLELIVLNSISRFKSLYGKVDFYGFMVSKNIRLTSL